MSDEHELVIVCVHVLNRTHDAKHQDSDGDSCYICSLCRDDVEYYGWDYVKRFLKTACRGCLGI